jgi:carbamoyl-phosphate synthase small subunit
MSDEFLRVFPEPTAALVLEDGTEFNGIGIGESGTAVGEVCFNTSMTGYQEIITDPSYAGQIITFTFPHIGNVGTNKEDNESLCPSVRGVVFRADISSPSNFRSCLHLDAWLKANKVVGLAGIDTRALTLHIRDGGPPKGVITYKGVLDDANQYRRMAANWDGLTNMDLASDVGTQSTFSWSEGLWKLGAGFSEVNNAKHHVVAIDYGAKHNIFRNLVGAGCTVTVVPPRTRAKAILDLEPDGLFLSNGPGDPAATGIYAVPVIRELLKSGLPIFGICLGHQLLALALGARTGKMRQGHRGANHPVKDLITGKVEITSQNHGFVVLDDSLPAGVKPTHISLFDKTIEGLKVEAKPIFSVQYHPEASPGPQDSHYLFSRFTRLMDVP